MQKKCKSITATGRICIRDSVLDGYCNKHWVKEKYKEEYRRIKDDEDSN